MLLHQMLQLQSIFRRAVGTFQIAIIERHWIVAKIGEGAGQPLAWAISAPSWASFLFQDFSRALPAKNRSRTCSAMMGARAYSPIPSKNSFTRAKKPAECGWVLSLEALSKSFSKSRCLLVRFFGVSTST